MPKRSSNNKKKKNPADINLLAAQIVEAATDLEKKPPTKKKKGAEKKNPAAVALGRLGGLKGGKARAEKLSPELRTKIASEAARIRWGKDSKNGEK
ncbi:MAG: hypothetical protein R3B95_19635 [Nitrospirales bacterium]|nr:hypothetical protein [Nitrospirales bacterium]